MYLGVIFKLILFLNTLNTCMISNNVAALYLSGVFI